MKQDMLDMVREQRPSYNNDGRVAGSTVKTAIKLMYVGMHMHGITPPHTLHTTR